MSESIGKKFIEETKFKHLTPSAQRRGAPAPPAFRPFPAAADRTPLPPASGLELAPLDFLQLVNQRRSLRRYAQTPLSLQELAFLLWCTQGLQAGRSHRTVPSAGARHPFETLLVVNQVQELTPGLYGYEPQEHALANLPAAPQLAADVAQACLGQGFIAQSAVTFIWIAVSYRTTWRYGERGYRYLHLDAGHLCQNLYLAAEAIGAGACAVAAFDDEALAELLQLDPAECFPIYLAAVGKR